MVVGTRAPRALLSPVTIPFLGTPEEGSGAGVAFLGDFFGEAKK
jgi:hypothetical protein